MISSLTSIATMLHYALIVRGEQHCDWEIDCLGCGKKGEVVSDMGEQRERLRMYGWMGWRQIGERRGERECAAQGVGEKGYLCLTGQG